jgi:hemerythrin-like domain-containing protein
MSGHDPIKMLTHEHDVILKVVEGLGKIGHALERGERADPETLRRIVRFMREFADRCHHAKEEDLLFPAMERKGVPESGCPLGGLRREHAEGRALVSALSDAVDRYAAGAAEARNEITTVTGKIAELYTNHIWKENEMVFPMAARLFSDAEREELFEKFEKAEREIGANHEELAAFAARLAG